MQLTVKKGLDIPMSGVPRGEVGLLPSPSALALSVEAFDDLRFRLLVKVGDRVKLGTPLVENKGSSGQFFVSPGSGTVQAIERGLKRRLLWITIALDGAEEREERSGFALGGASYDQLVEVLQRGGVFGHLRMRPFDLPAHPRVPPRAIFVKAVESLPYLPSAEMQVEGHEEDFGVGLEVLRRLTSGKVHLVHRRGTHFSAFTDAQGVERHSIVGPHPAGLVSCHIHAIAPIRSVQECIWTLSALEVVILGHLIRTGHYFTPRILALGGSGIHPGQQQFFRGRAGFPIAPLLEGRRIGGAVRLLSGDPLMGSEISEQGFLGFYHTAFTVLAEETEREPFHFFRLGRRKYSAHGVYASSHCKPPPGGYRFTTNLHGEERAFIDGSVYDRYMPMQIPVMHLVKAVLAEDYELAQALGFLEVAPEDFALPTFLCPSKIEMVEIMKKGLHRFAKEMGY